MSTPNRQLEARAEARTRIISPEVRRRALLLAIAADVLQLGLLPLFGAGWLAPLNDVLDVIIAILMVHRLGWHMAFLPTLVAELLPVVDIFPSWTLAVLFVTRSSSSRLRRRISSAPWPGSWEPSPVRSVPVSTM